MKSSQFQVSLRYLQPRVSEQTVEKRETYACGPEFHDIAMTLMISSIVNSTLKICSVTGYVKLCGFGCRASSNMNRQFPKMIAMLSWSNH